MKEQMVNLFNRVGLSRVAIDLADLMKTSIRLKTEKAEEKDISIGSCKFGGVPDLPMKWNWPEWEGKPLSFICQLNFKELNIHNIDEQLPISGILYFFYEADGQPWGFDPNDKGCCKVLFYNGSSDMLNRTKFPESLPEECKFESGTINFNIESTMPCSDSLYINQLRLNTDELNIFSKLEDMQQEQSDEETIHRLFGYADEIQGEMETECCLVNNGVDCGDSSGYKSPKGKDLMKYATDWKLLLQMDSEEELGFMWGDLGRIYFWIHKDDLKNRNFDNVWLILQSS